MDIESSQALQSLQKQKRAVLLEGSIAERA
jgi:hypothetical protein